jgi:hypothetical protein
LLDWAICVDCTVTSFMELSLVSLVTLPIHSLAVDNLIVAHNKVDLMKS